MIIDNIEWNEEKDKWLQEIRGVSFKDVAVLISQRDIIDVYDHPNQERYPGQQFIVVKLNDYAYLVPFVENGGRLFLKTVIPSRKATRKYLNVE